MLHKISNSKKCPPRLIFFYKNFFYKDLDDFWRWKLTLKIRFWLFLTAIFGHLTSLMEKSIPFFVISAVIASIWNVFMKFRWDDDNLNFCPLHFIFKFRERSNGKPSPPPLPTVLRLEISLNVQKFPKIVLICSLDLYWMYFVQKYTSC